MRWLALVLALLGWAGTAQAQDTPPDWVGVWEGTIGRYPIVACLDERYGDEGIGSYYYLSQLKPIRLRGGIPTRSWAEDTGEGLVGTEAIPAWDIASITATAISGTWRAGNRRLAIALTRIPDDGEDYDGPCASRAFFAARLAPATFNEEASVSGTFDYTTRTYEVPAHFEDVAISGFSFAQQQPGDQAIADWLEAQLPQGRFEDDFVQCVGSALVAHGVDGYFEKSLSLAFANGEIMAVTSSNSTYCGGAHPNHWQVFTSFDRQSGAELDPANWFNARGAVTNDYGSLEISAELRAVVMQYWSEPDEDGEEWADDCSDYVREHPWWSYQLLGQGILFQPDLPHVATACEAMVTVPWDALGAFLSPAGEALRERATR